MTKDGKIYVLPVLFLSLLFSTIYIFYLDWQASKREFTFAALDVGQGDALFVESPTGVQILIDGGPPRKILGELSRVMPRFDKSIDAILITHPDQDHIGGFLDVLKNYKVGAVFESGTFNDSQTYENLKQEIKNKNIREILVRRGMRLNLGQGTSLDILFPDRDVSGWTTNDGSIVGKLTYGNTRIMLMGDATRETERIILEENSPENLRSEILKVGHHGSRTSTSEEFVKAVAPKYALISSGRDNRYGHPHRETLQTLEQNLVKVFRTDLLGSVVVEAKGDVLRWQHERQTSGEVD